MKSYVKNLKAALGQDADRSDNRRILKHGSHSFYAASLLLPDEYCEPITALYAFCREADDAVDLAEDPAEGLLSIRERLERIYRDEPIDSPVDREFTDVVHAYRIPYELPAALIEGFEWDVNGKEYHSLSDLYDYCTRVAGTVGIMMALLMGVRKTDVISRACDLGVAMQLTNICRDVGEDTNNGRLYLPRELLDEHRLDVDRWMQSPVPCLPVTRTLTELLRIADRHYRRSEWGISKLPISVRPGIFAARAIYAEIGRQVESNAYDSVTTRAYVGKRRKAALLAQATRNAFRRYEHDHAPPLKETEYLLNAVARS
ncbi:MAG: phytoene/squalene synthase family protein [Pseudomonadota bacterium]